MRPNHSPAYCWIARPLLSAAAVGFLATELFAQASVPAGGATNSGATGTSQNASIPSAETGSAQPANPSSRNGDSPTTSPGSFGNPADNSSLGNTGDGNARQSNVGQRPGTFRNGARNRTSGRLSRGTRSAINPTPRIPSNFYSVPARGMQPGGNDTTESFNRDNSPSSARALDNAVGPRAGFESVPSGDRGFDLNRFDSNDAFDASSGSSGNLPFRRGSSGINNGGVPTGTDNALSIPSGERSQAEQIANPDGAVNRDNLSSYQRDGFMDNRPRLNGINSLLPVPTEVYSDAELAALGLVDQTRMRSGERILTVNGHAATNIDQLEALSTELAGRRVPVTFERNGQIDTFFYDFPANPVDRSPVATTPGRARGMRPVTGAYVVARFNGSGAQLSRVEPGSLAESAGLRPADVIVKFDDMEITSNRDLSRSLSDWDGTTNAHLMVWRDGRSVPVVLRGNETEPRLRERRPVENDRPPSVRDEQVNHSEPQAEVEDEAQLPQLSAIDERVLRLEAEIQALRGEIAALRAQRDDSEIAK